MSSRFDAAMRDLSPEQTVLIAGPTASGKSALALEIADRQGGVIVNADASQIYDCWRVITARPSVADEAAAPHRLYGHVSAHDPYSVGHWLREIEGLLAGDARLIIVGGTGLYFSALTQGLVDSPSTPPDIRAAADAMDIASLRRALDPQTADGLDLENRARVQRAWEVLTTTGRGLAAWQSDPQTPLLPLAKCHPISVSVDRNWLNTRIEKRFDIMLAEGALEEVEAIRPEYDPTLPAHRAIGVPELMGYLDGATTLEAARTATVIATRQFAKRQRTWARSKMADWHPFIPA